MKVFRMFGFLVALALIVVHFCTINYQDLSFKTNGSHYLGIVAMVFLGLSFLMGIIKDRNQE
jgi:hypothetical protein